MDNENYAKEIIKLTANTLNQFQADDFNDGLFGKKENNEKNLKLRNLLHEI